MEDFADRTINELVESYPIFVDALKEEYNILTNMLDIIFSSCSIKTKTEKPGPHSNQIIYEVFDCFFEYQIYKIMEKYRYYEKIRNQTFLVERIYRDKQNCDLKISNSFDFYSIRLGKTSELYIDYCSSAKTIDIVFGRYFYT